MPEIIDLVSSDPPVPSKSPPSKPKQSVEHPSRRPSHHLNPISSDSFDASLLNYDEIFDKPAKKRRVDDEGTSSFRQSTTPNEHPTQTAAPEPWFLISDDDFDLPPSNPTVQKRPSEAHVEESDPIVPTSSAPPLPKPSSQRRDPTSRDISAIDDNDEITAPMKHPTTGFRARSDIDEFSDPFVLPEFSELLKKPSQDATSSNPLFSESTARLLARISERDKPNINVSGAQINAGARKSGVSTKTTATEFLSDDDIAEPTAPRKTAKKASKVTAAEKEAKAKAREEAKLQRERERELEKERKLKLKEEKAKEKQRAADIASVNKLKINKKDATPEMIVDMATTLEESSVGNQTVEFMKRLGVHQTFFPSAIPNVVKWRRKMNATYNKALRYWEPCPFFIQNENLVLCLVPAQEFINMVTPPPEAEERETLDTHVLRIKSAYPDCKLIYLIEGLKAFMRKNTNARNRAFQAEVLRQMAAETTVPEEPTAGRAGVRKPRKKANAAPLVDDETVEDALLQLQVAHSCLIHHTTTPANSAEWIKTFTENISTAPYRRERQEAHNAAFCMDTGQVKTGVDKRDTFIRMMQEINRITAPMAYGIAGQYPCVTDLSRAMRIHGPMMLEDIKKSANKNGSLTNARIGPAASRRLYKVFTGLDPKSTDV